MLSPSRPLPVKRRVVFADHSDVLSRVFIAAPSEPYRRANPGILMPQPLPSTIQTEYDSSCENQPQLG